MNPTYFTVKSWLDDAEQRYENATSGAYLFKTGELTKRKLAWDVMYVCSFVCP
jgi:hypothetical protein